MAKDKELKSVILKTINHQYPYSIQKIDIISKKHNQKESSKSNSDLTKIIKYNLEGPLLTPKTQRSKSLTNSTEDNSFLFEFSSLSSNSRCSSNASIPQMIEEQLSDEEKEEEEQCIHKRSVSACGKCKNKLNAYTKANNNNNNTVYYSGRRRGSLPDVIDLPSIKEPILENNLDENENEELNLSVEKEVEKLLQFNYSHRRRNTIGCEKEIEDDIKNLDLH